MENPFFSNFKLIVRKITNGIYQIYKSEPKHQKLNLFEGEYLHELDLIPLLNSTQVLIIDQDSNVVHHNIKDLQSNLNEKKSQNH
ncbi:hypothetical protein AAGG74_16955 [Bacillus mexicanus]|uniref:hypothetical protein n=1 Tax=Bacillus mexicanus TaxID=2834415 RepID=UPI003D1DD088